MFRTMFTESKRFNIEAGSGEAKEYTIKKNELVQTGTKDLYSEIQSHKEECDIEQIISRVKLGDTSGLREDGNYIDCTVFPKGLNKTREIISKAEDEFNNLPIEIRNKFGNNFDTYMNAYGTEEFNKILLPGTTKKKEIEQRKIEVKTEEVKENE